MHKQMKKKRSEALRKLTVTAVLIAIMFALSMMGLGIIYIPPVSATVLAVPVIIGAIWGGAGVGLPLGAAFGVLSWYNSLSSPSPLSVCFADPRVSILPRLMIPLMVALCMYLCRGPYAAGKTWPLAVGAVVGSLTNTAFVMGALALFYGELASQVFGSPQLAFTALGTTAAINGSAEAVIAVVICVPVLKALRKI